MNPSQRDAWPPHAQPSMNMQQNNDQLRPQVSDPSGTFAPNPPGHQSVSSNGAVLPPPAPFHPAAAGPSGPGLPSLVGMAPPSSGLSGHRTSHSSHDQPINQQPYNSSGQPPNYPLGGLQQNAPPTLPNQSSFDRDREVHEAREREAREREFEVHTRREQQREVRERDFEMHARREQQRERENREREQRDRQAREQAPQHQNHVEQMQLHQPAPVGPQVRSAIHGPNGLLANAAPQSIPPSAGSMGNPMGSAGMFGGPPQLIDGPSRNTIQPSSSGTLTNIMPFGGAQASHQIPGPGAAQGQQPILNDALSYLDQVKVQFVTEPNVYNQFLDIMKDFKSQAIDTPGVIRRVSSLFAGNPNLIQGFNTFLPPGYRIECGTADDPNAIRVTTPQGTTVSPMGSALRPLSNPRSSGINGITSSQPQVYDGLNRNAESSWQPPPGHDTSDGLFSPRNPRAALPIFGQTQGHSHESSIPRDQNGLGVNAAAVAHQQQERGVSQLQSAVTAASGEGVRNNITGMQSTDQPNPLPGDINSASMTSQQNGPSAMEKRGPVEFNHAISYVNKIKNRFSQQPEIYKQFLEILQTYQRESKPIQDVYAQVTSLFNGAPDLLEDFKQFLPESAAQAKAAAARQAAEDATMLSNVRTEAFNSATQVQHTPRPEQHRLPPIGNFAPTPSAGRDIKRKRNDRQGQPGVSSTFSSSIGHDYGSTGRNGIIPSKRTKQIQQPQQQQPQQQQIIRSEAQSDLPAISPTLVPALPQPMPPMSTTAATSDELAAFDRVKKFIGNKNTMNEFLKLCNLFSQDLIDKNLLVHRMQNFIGGSPELYQYFKDFLGYDGKDEVIENRARPVSGRVALSNCRGLGPSYRLLPKKERTKTCSGRDEICNAVLNDEWATHPTWASEESGFAAHRKNIHEDGLHRIEEERHDYDLNIGICERTIQLLEPIAQHIRMLPDEEKSSYVLQPHLGGPSETIYKRMIMKIYGREQGRLVIENMFSQPVTVVPIVLLRCRQKLEEWKASQREWEKVWREQTQKMFWRSLDHQGISAKMVDKRQFQPKTLQNEILVKYEEQKRQRQNQYNKVPRDQAVYTFDDAEVLTDATRLLLIHAEHTHSTDFPRLTAFIRDFVPLFFSLTAEAFEERIQDVFEAGAHDEEMYDDSVAAENGGQYRSRKTTKKHDLLRGVLSRHGRIGRKDKEDSIASGSRGSTPDLASAVGDDDVGVTSNKMTPSNEDPLLEPPTNKWLDHPIEGNLRPKIGNIRPNEPYLRHTYNLYANLDIYCFFRVFVILYERLLKLKLNESEVHETVRRAKFPKAALDLHMVDKQPSNFFEDTSPTANYYEQMLHMLDDNVRGELEMPQIEEVLRRYYLASGWQLYSFDRLLGSLVRFAIAILSSDVRTKNGEILQLWMKDRKKEYTTHEDELNFRRQSERHIKDGDVYRIAFDESNRVARVRILPQDEATFSAGSNASHEGFLTPEQRWQYYVSSYSSMPPTEGIPYDEVRMPFLRRAYRESQNALMKQILDGDVDADGGHLAEVENRLDQIRSKEGLVLRIAVDTYRIWYSEVGSEEWWITDNSTTRSSRIENTVEIAEPSATTPPEAEDGQEHRQDHESRDNAFQEKFVMNNKWMAGLRRDEVEKTNREFREWREGNSEFSPKILEDTEMEG